MVESTIIESWKIVILAFIDSDSVSNGNKTLTVTINPLLSTLGMSFALVTLNLIKRLDC